jgi:hypothetical protein
MKIMNNQDYRNMWAEVMRDIDYLGWLTHNDDTVAKLMVNDWTLWNQCGAPVFERFSVDDMRFTHKMHKQGKWYSVQSGFTHYSK